MLVVVYNKGFEPASHTDLPTADPQKLQVRNTKMVDAIIARHWDVSPNIYTIPSADKSLVCYILDQITTKRISLAHISLICNGKNIIIEEDGTVPDWIVA